MKKLILAIAVMLALVGCDDNSNKAPEKLAAEIAQEVPKADHYYSIKDGYEYGYEQAISQNSLNAGQIASALIMFKYAGEKNGVYQAFSNEATGATTVLQCNNPCDFIKVMVFLDGEHIKTERVKAVAGSIGWTVMSDAINGKLEQYIRMNKQTNKKVNVWFAEQEGMEATPIKQ